MPELTVSMPAYNTGKFIRESIESVLNQKDIDLELIVVDDGSKDSTAEVVRSIKDSRLEFIQNDRNMGIAYCHNLIIEKSKSPFISHVDSDDIILEGALRRLVDELKKYPKAGQSHSHFFYMDEQGETTRKSFRAIRDHLLENRKTDIDYKWNLLVHGSIINHLRTYRKDIFDTVGKFDESLKYGVDYEMALRIIDKYDIRLVPEFLYCMRTHKNSTTSRLPIKGLSFWLQRLSICRKLLNSNKISFVKEEKYNLNKLMRLGLYYTLRLNKSEELLRSIKKTPGDLKDFFLKKTPDFITDKLYLGAGKYLSFWPIDLFKNKINGAISERKTAYYIWQFPVLSQTFIRRELKALIKSGACIEVIADEKGDFKLQKNDSSLMKDVHYLYPFDDSKMSEYKDYFYRKNPLGYVNLFFYVICHRYGSYKSYNNDRAVFHKAVYLAGKLKENNINHIHCPWSDTMAFIALIASRLSGIKYTVQARAHDIHRVTHKFALKEKFENADVVITNTLYNENHIKSFLNNGAKSKIHTIYEGIGLNQFRPEQKNGSFSKEIRILSVARLIEEKGLIYLLKACRILKDKGFSFKCEIVGGSEEPLYRSYLIYLKKLHLKLELQDNVFFLGNRPLKNVIKKYKESDIFVLPCVVAENGGRDTSPNSIIEAMAMKLPVITTSISALPELVDHDINGIIIEPKDEHALSKAMIKLINSPDLRKKLGENGRKKVRQRFNISKNITKYCELFSS